MTTPVTIPLPDGTAMPAHIALPAQGIPTGAVLIVPSIFGSDAGTLALADSVARAGHPALVPTLFHRTDPGPCGFDSEGWERARSRMRLYDREQGLADLAAAVDWLRDLPEATSWVVAHGICFGGHLAAMLALHGHVDALSTVHGGGLDQVATQGPLHVPAALHFGAADPSIPAHRIDTVQAAWPKADVVIYQDADHGFAHPGSPKFVPEAYRSSLDTLLRLAGGVG